jgi:ATP-dependent RNA helicase DDX56/DBP9
MKLIDATKMKPQKVKKMKKGSTSKLSKASKSEKSSTTIDERAEGIENNEEEQNAKLEDPKVDANMNEANEAEEEPEEVLSFTEMGIDDRILLALIELNWSEPTPIQETAIPLVLSGRDILAKARTGSGKTGAYAIPMIQKILNMKKHGSSKTSQISALILTPSRELCSQAARNMHELMKFCQREITLVDLSTSQMNYAAMRQSLATRPDVVIATPAKILAHLKDTTLKPPVDLKNSLELLVIDEADLLLSFGYEEEVKSLVKLAINV